MGHSAGEVFGLAILGAWGQLSLGGVCQEDGRAVAFERLKSRIKSFSSERRERRGDGGSALTILHFWHCI